MDSPSPKQVFNADGYTLPTDSELDAAAVISPADIAAAKARVKLSKEAARLALAVETDQDGKP